MTCNNDKIVNDIIDNYDNNIFNVVLYIFI